MKPTSLVKSSETLETIIMKAEATLVEIWRKALKERRHVFNSEEEEEEGDNDLLES